MAVTVSPLAPDDEDGLRAWFAIEEATHAVDRPEDPPPVWDSHRAQLSAPEPGFVTSAWLAHRTGSALGAARLQLPGRDNLDTALAEIAVHPAHRRTGVGRVLLDLLVDAARRAGRVRLIGEVRSPLHGPSPGTAFARAAGAKDAQVEIQRRLDVARTAPAVEPAGWPLVRWAGATPEDRLDDIARLEGRMSTDAPHGELTWAPEVYDAGRVRELDAMCAARGIVRLTTAAVAPDGRLAAFTQIGTQTALDHHAHNWNTLVLPEHRGRRLGMRVKVANLAYLRELRPSVRWLTTWNAASNTHMIAINEALGFRPVDALHEFELDI